MELSELESFHFLYRSVWNQNTDERVVRHKVNIMDTIIFLQGFPVRWLFTSEKTGEVLRKKDMNTKDIITSLKSRAAKLKTSDAQHAKSLKKKRGACFAVVWYKNEAGVMDFYRLLENQLLHVLKERLFTQAIVAVQVYFDPMPLKGSGIFEHHYSSQMVRNVGAHKTYELVETPPSPNFFDMHERVIEQGTYEEFAMSQSQAHMLLRPDLAGKKVSRELTTITETQHNLIKVSVTKLLKLMEALIGGEVQKATFVFYFNENWSPFIVATKNIVVQATIATARILMYTGNDHMDTLDTATPLPPPASPYTSPFVGTDRKKVKKNERKMVKDFRSLKHMSSKALSAHGGSARSVDSDSDYSSDYFSDDDHRRNSSGRTPQHSPMPGVDRKKLPPGSPTPSRSRRGSTISNKSATAIAKNSSSYKLKPSDSNFIPPPKPHLPASTTQYTKEECTPEKKPKRRAGVGLRTTALQKILSDANKNETKVQFSDTSEPVPTGNKKTVQPGVVKSYMMNTEQSNIKVRAYKEDLCGRDSTTLANRRPISAPHDVRRSSALLNYQGNDPFASADLRDGRFRGTMQRTQQTQQQKTFRKKLLLQKDTCFGDYCGILSKYLEEWEIDESLIKIKNMYGKDSLKSTKITCQIPIKSVFLCRSEVAFSGFEIAMQENLECLGHDRVEILTACANNHINNVNDKCRREALIPILSMAQLKISKQMPNIKEMMIAAYVYRNMVYNEALSKVHPSRFYYTVPVCEVCNDIYTALDEARERVIYRKPNLNKMSSAALRDQDTQSHVLGDTDSSGSFEDRINRARENLKKQAEKNRAEREEKDNNENNENSTTGDVFKKSLDSSKIPWESNFVYEMNALQQGSVVLAGVSMEESVFLEETDVMAEQFQQHHHQRVDPDRQHEENKLTSGRRNHKEALPDTNVVSQSLPLKDYQQSMTALLNPTLGKGNEVTPADVQHGVLKSKSQNVIPPASTTIASNTFSSWANLLDAANHKGKRRKPVKGFKLRTSYKDNPAAERKRQEVLENRRLDRQHEIWSGGLRNPHVQLGVRPQTAATSSTGADAIASNKKVSTTRRRPQSAGVNHPSRQSTSKNTLTRADSQQERALGKHSSAPSRSNQDEHESDEGGASRMHHFHSPSKGCGQGGTGAGAERGRFFELETPEDVKEFNDIKVDILKHRGLHSVPVRKQATQVLCGGEFTQVLLAPASEEGSPHVSPQCLPMDQEGGEGEGSAFTSINLLDTCSSALFVPQVYSNSYPVQEQTDTPLHSKSKNSGREAMNADVQHDGGDVKQFVSELLKHSPMSPQNINYISMQNTEISNEVKKMIDELEAEKNS